MHQKWPITVKFLPNAITNVADEQGTSKAVVQGSNFSDPWTSIFKLGA